MNNLEKKVADTAIIILAAGNSSRLGQPKQLVEIQGKTLLNNMIETARLSSAMETFVVLGDQYLLHRQYLPEGVGVTVNEAWGSGMGTSLKKGLQYALLSKPALRSVIISVCDQPYLTSEIFSGMIDMFRKNEDNIVAAKYQNGIFGVPVLFPKKYFNDLNQCDDKSGAKPIIKRNLNKVDFIAFNKGYIDIDTPQDLAELIKLNGGE